MPTHGMIKYIFGPDYNTSYENATAPNTFQNTTLTFFQGGGPSSVSRVDMYGGATITNSDYNINEEYAFTCGQTDGQYLVIMLDELKIYGAVENAPTFTTNVTETAVITQLSPEEGSIQNGVDTFFNCTLETISSTGANISNATINVYDSLNNLNYTQFFDYDGLDLNYTTNSFNLNLSTPDLWSWSCAGATTPLNVQYSSANTTFTVDTGVPEITLIAPIIDGNTSIVISTYITTDATAISCYWSVDASSNTSIGCTPDGVKPQPFLICQL